jgi:hypothetical protein
MFRDWHGDALLEQVIIGVHETPEEEEADIGCIAKGTAGTSADGVFAEFYPAVSWQILVGSCRGGWRPRERVEDCEKEDGPSEGFRFHDLAPEIQQESEAGGLGDFGVGAQRLLRIRAVSLSIESW